MRQKVRLLRLVATVPIVLSALLPLTTATAQAASLCSGHCLWEPQGSSGTGARGTESSITLPYNESVPASIDFIGGAVFLYASSTSAIETGLAYGYTSKCGKQNNWHPYGTLNNGGNEQDDCAYHVPDSSSWKIWAYVKSGGLAYSYLTDLNTYTKWYVSWGKYDITGQNTDHTEVHGYNDQPYFAGNMTFYGEEWEHTDETTWSNWSYTNVSSWCPFDAYWQSNNSWFSYDANSC